MSSSRPEGAEQAAVLARKARADATAMRELAGNPEITDEIGDWIETQLSAEADDDEIAEGGEEAPSSPASP